MLRKYKAYLKQKEAAHKWQQKLCINQKHKIQAIEEQSGVKLSKKLQKEEKQVGNEELIAAISRIATSGSAAHERHQSEIIWTVKTLQQLIKVLNRDDYNLKRSSVYLRLLPKNGRTREGKQHVTTVPVNLISAKNSKHQSHPGTKFARATITALEELVGLLAPGDVTFHS